MHLKCRGMRDNLLFYSVPADRGELDDAWVDKLFLHYGSWGGRVVRRCRVTYVTGASNR